MKKEKILFFIADFNPTEKERKEAAKLGTKMFRCAKMVSKTSPIEDFDKVYGCVPEAYLAKAEAKKNIISEEIEMPVVMPTDEKKPNFPAFASVGNTTPNNTNTQTWKPN